MRSIKSRVDLIPMIFWCRWFYFFSAINAGHFFDMLSTRWQQCVVQRQIKEATMKLSFGLSCDLRQNNQSCRLTLTSNMCAVRDDTARNPASVHVVKLEEQHGRSCVWAPFRSKAASALSAVGSTGPSGIRPVLHLIVSVNWARFKLFSKF